MEIQVIDENDLEEIAFLYQQLSKHNSDLGKMKSALRQAVLNSNHILLGAKVNGRLIGSLAGNICTTLFGKCNPFLVVEDVVVDESERRAGVGKALMIRLETIAKKTNCSYIFLLTDSDRPEAHYFYEALGYKSEPYRGYKKILTSNY
ncbi:putative acetyltransferase [Chitinispirillum alkaliphilum]|nr:putative acetyltransferase [Chitinispirillum alkaliphilum]